ncbi:MAG: hypothetical protein JOZ88_13945 [Hyphomicrobiales bacterium]|nr:hypothetical protein [Hyphomicrobiales bacterium]
MSELAGFAGRALRMILADDGLKKALDEQQTLAREMSHRAKNLFSIIESVIRIVRPHFTQEGRGYRGPLSARACAGGGKRPGKAQLQRRRAGRQSRSVKAISS